jgi:hypothetical protein
MVRLYIILKLMGSKQRRPPAVPEVSLAEIMDFAQHTSKAIAAKDVAGLLEAWDADGDGHLSLEEHLAASGAGEAGEAGEARDTEEEPLCCEGGSVVMPRTAVFSMFLHLNATQN